MDMNIFRKKKIEQPKSVDLEVDNRLEQVAKDLFESNKGFKPSLFNIENDYITLYLVGVPRHGNMGDHAMQTGIYSFVKRVIPSIQIKAIDCLSFYKNLKQFRKMVKPYDILSFYSGGNMGNQYYEEEFARQELIKSFPNNIIISFPQTLYFIENSSSIIEYYSKFLKENYDYDINVKPDIGTAGEIKRFKEIYGNHKYLHIFARDKDSYDTLKLFLPEQNVYLVPDMAMSLGGLRFEDANREDATLCCRADCERVLSDEKHMLIKQQLEKYGKLKQNDTDIGFDIQEGFAENHFYELLMEFRKSKVVVTDRLHGLIFAAITSTPCVAFGNYNAKTKGAHDWLKYLPYLDYCDDISTLEEKLLKVTSCEAKYNATPINEAFAKLENVLKDAYTISNKAKNMFYKSRN